MLKHLLSITNETLTSLKWQKRLDELFEYSSKIEKSSSVFVSGKKTSMLAYFVRTNKPRLTGPRIQKLFMPANQIVSYPELNQVPRMLRRYAGPEFFSISPNGEIWFVE